MLIIGAWRSLPVLLMNSERDDQYIFFRQPGRKPHPMFIIVNGSLFYQE